MILVIIGFEGGDKDCVGIKMVGGQYILINTTISDGEAPIVVCVELGYQFGPNVHLV